MLYKTKKLKNYLARRINHCDHLNVSNWTTVSNRTPPILLLYYGVFRLDYRQPSALGRLISKTSSHMFLTLIL